MALVEEAANGGQVVAVHALQRVRREAAATSAAHTSECATGREMHEPHGDDVLRDVGQIEIEAVHLEPALLLRDYAREAAES